MFGQIPDFTNSFDFMRRLWGGSAGMPGGLMPGLQAMTPPMDLDDLDKRIADLKAVESWLQLNTNLLRTTIQGLEVQRATLVALQTFGNALSPDAMQAAMENVARAANTPSASPPQRAGADTGAGPREEAPAAQAASQPAGEPEPAPEPSATPETAPNAGLWWDLLQQQFNQIASSAAAASIAPFNMGAFSAGGTAAQPGAAPDAGAGSKAAPRKTAGNGNGARASATAKNGATSAAKPGTKPAAKPAAKKPAAKKPAAGKTANATTAGNGTAKDDINGGNE
ncbi:PhaM family polyhydroxyalkanoate granule multifunctional regulatory protein [Cupriavidus sp. NPDC089707]|uniref:PhaM family polyhydroxyalkanoate granule multifunctional regulatory protein n=1 Tax=Cupriavidus sp. NPDC089707 TaxID=3363963 RepID=UPI003828BD04